MKRPIFWTVVLLALSLVSAAATEEQPPHSKRASPPASGGPVAPAGTLIPLEIKNTINSHGAYVGEAIYCETLYPVTAEDRVLIPAHSFVKGSVADVVRPGHIKGKATLSLRIDPLTLPDGTTRPLQATVYSLAGTRLNASRAEEEAAEPPEGGDIAVSGGQEEVVDASGLGGPSAISAVSEGVGGLVVMLVTRGKTIILRPGTTLEIQLTAPLNFGPAGANAPAEKPGTLRHRPAKAGSPTPGMGSPSQKN